MRVSGWTGILCAALCGHALGQEPQDPKINPPKETWTLRFEPVVWFSAPGGKIEIPGSPSGTARVDLTNLDLDSPRLNPGGTIYLNADRWHFMASGFRLEEDDRRTASTFSGQLGPVPFSPGDTLISSLTFTSFEASVLRSLELPDSLSGKTGKDFVASLDVGVGVRVYDVDFQFSAPAGTTSTDEFFVHPVVTVQLSMDLIEQFTVRAGIDIGGFATGGDDINYAYNITTAFVWRPTHTVGVEIGYRDLAYLLRSGSSSNRFEYSGALQGLFAGVDIRF